MQYTHFLSNQNQNNQTSICKTRRRLILWFLFKSNLTSTEDIQEGKEYLRHALIILQFFPKGTSCKKEKLRQSVVCLHKTHRHTHHLLCSGNCLTNAHSVTVVCLHVAFVTNTAESSIAWFAVCGVFITGSVITQVCNFKWRREKKPQYSRTCFATCTTVK